MIRRPPRATRTDTHFPYTTLFPSSAPRVDFKIGATLVVAPIEVVDGGNAGLPSRLAEGIQYLPRQALALDAPASRRAVKFAWSSMMLFDMLENRQYVVPAPAGIALRRPGVVVGRLTAHINHAVDGRTAPQDAAARITQAAVVYARIGLRAVAPVGARITDALQCARKSVVSGRSVAVRVDLGGGHGIRNTTINQRRY